MCTNTPKAITIPIITMATQTKMQIHSRTSKDHTKATHLRTITNAHFRTNSHEKCSVDKTKCKEDATCEI
jgi:hypothetical protein